MKAFLKVTTLGMLLFISHTVIPEAANGTNGFCEYTENFGQGRMTNEFSVLRKNIACGGKGAPRRGTQGSGSR